jgi:hypothetical protein
VVLERGPCSVVSIREEVLEREIAATVKKTEINGRNKSWHLFLRPVAVAQSVYFACGLKARELV